MFFPAATAAGASLQFTLADVAFDIFFFSDDFFICHVFFAFDSEQHRSVTASMQTTTQQRPGAAAYEQQKMKMR